MLENTYHLTQRCHGRGYLLRFAADRDTCQEWLREGVSRYRVPVYGYCITSNHIHVLAHADDEVAISRFMHLVTGATAKRYNVRKERTGSMWEHPFHCTAVENGRHLLNCLVYINMNMVRAGAVPHPHGWKWCSHDELLGQRQRYRILNRDRLLESLGANNTEILAEWYEENLGCRMRAGQMAREAHWSESLAVGSQPFVMRASQAHANRRSFSFSDVSGNSGTMWSVREAQCERHHLTTGDVLSPRRRQSFVYADSPEKWRAKLC
jgi:putative transposase